jgi:hypothetical protein
MELAHKTLPYRHFDIPDDIVILTMDPKTGAPANKDAGGVRTFFRRENAPH